MKPTNRQILWAKFHFSSIR